MAIEYARYVLGHERATSEEFGEEGEFVVYKLPKLDVGLHDGESFWHNYEVLPEIAKMMQEQVFTDKYFGVQYHPEYNSMPGREHPVLVKFLKACSAE